MGCKALNTLVLGKQVYLAKDEKAAKRVPNREIPVFLESDLKAVKGLSKEEAKLIFGGSFVNLGFN